MNDCDYPKSSNPFVVQDDNNETFNTTDPRCSSPFVNAQDVPSSNEVKLKTSGNKNPASSSKANAYVLRLRKVLKKTSSNEGKPTSSGDNKRANSSQANPYVLLLRKTLKALKKAKSSGDKLCKGAKSRLATFSLLLWPRSTTSRHTETAESAPAPSENTIGEQVSKEETQNIQLDTNKRKKGRAPFPPQICPGKSNMKI
jgi:hypothetical protein